MESAESRIRQANGRLKYARIGVTINKRGDRLYLRATLPPRLGSAKTAPYQQEISLGVMANNEGIKFVEQEARRIGVLLSRKEFQWEEFLEDQVVALTIQDWVQRFEEDYFNRRARNSKSLTTWQGDYLYVFKRLPQGSALTAEVLRQVVMGTAPDTKTRKRYCMATRALANFAGIEFDPRPYAGNYSAKRVTPRDLPTDEQIVEMFNSINNPAYRWAFGVMAALGLRPSEVFNCDLEAFKAQSDGVIHVLDGKTGERKVWPCYAHWVELFQLQDVCLPQVTGKTNRDLGDRITHYMGRHKLIQAYNLRHAYAVRLMQSGWDLSLAARMMGHSVKVHTEQYHAWITDRHFQQAFENIQK